jgi:hypothetical protein
MGWLQRLRWSIVRTDDEPSDSAKAEDRSPEELQEIVRHTDEKERAIGLIAAPLAAALAFVIIDTLVKNDPAIGMKNYVNPSLYHSLLFVLLGLAVITLVSALLRKRLFLGIALALYGLAVFNLHYWGFGVPFLLAGAWYLVRTYRLQQELKRATGGAGGSGRPKGAAPTNGARPRPNKRYTPPT